MLAYIPAPLDHGSVMGTSVTLLGARIAAWNSVPPGTRLDVGDFPPGTSPRFCDPRREEEYGSQNLGPGRRTAKKKILWGSDTSC